MRFVFSMISNCFPAEVQAVDKKCCFGEAGSATEGVEQVRSGFLKEFRFAKLFDKLLFL